MAVCSHMFLDEKKSEQLIRHMYKSSSGEPPGVGAENKSEIPPRLS